MIKLYTKARCAPCRGLKQYLDQKEIPYSEISIGTKEFLEMQKSTGYRTVPVIDIDGEIMLGTNPKLYTVLREKGYTKR